MHKLKNQQGATLMMALLLLLAASMVSAVILTAATSSARRLENDRAARQAYLTVSSAARLLRDDILNASFVQETVKTTYTNDTSTETSRETTSPTGFTAAWLKAGKAAVDRDSGKSFTDTITLSVDGLDDVSAVFTMAPNYDITIVLHLADGGDSDCRLVLTLRENKADPAVSTGSSGGRLGRDTAAAVSGSAMSPRPQQRSPGRRTTPPSKRRRSYQKAEQHPRRNAGRDAGLHPDHRTDLRVSDHRRRFRRQDQR